MGGHVTQRMIARCLTENPSTVNARRSPALHSSPAQEAFAMHKNSPTNITASIVLSKKTTHAVIHIYHFKHDDIAKRFTTKCSNYLLHNAEELCYGPRDPEGRDKACVILWGFGVGFLVSPFCNDSEQNFPFHRKQGSNATSCT